MTNFVGDHPCKLDGKSRILFPAALKKQMEGDNDRFVVKKDLFENCLVLYTLQEWERQNQQIRQKINTFNKEHNAFLRGFYRGTAEVILDSSSRLLIPKRLLDIVGIDKEVILAGQDAKIEIWAKEAYENLAHDEEDFAALAEKIMQGTKSEEA
ncbi:MAG TPA: division/cell wall cluster transcriptional repressor MraZ [Marinilabiliales bacterium]|jgi:MraZ protein|nr:MAG: division/cell wall cluster transcriptional repressor MraZ [Bacteroidetes bacterium GWA2_40_14]OFX65605.1 MAG: division/cell wall cluster transcriptional repressor MraZ [Bacteroidetes bacterium GWC2_40_13]OFX75783.1 MAG: division/cell wall cluster transcriptional repressor MraZ [Bacteroidetes bacterium GWD2_40_43]OFX94944.1 MAG: division/cell wall cluster transcriptional repressor MraZ [Bacteroidetes bacterium GWE2_40_63]OFY23456.1 MAG: division/cell wall cluster transcriptional represso